MTATLPSVAPNPPGRIPAAQAQRLEAARDAKAAADEELRLAVLDALAAGGSVRQVAELGGLSTNTVQRWKGEARG